MKKKGGSFREENKSRADKSRFSEPERGKSEMISGMT